MNYFHKDPISKMILKNEIDDEYIHKLYLMAKETEFLELKENETLFRIGDFGDKFFYILSGTVEIFKLDESSLNLSLDEYFDILRVMREKDESYICKKIISSNKKNIDVN